MLRPADLATTGAPQREPVPSLELSFSLTLVAFDVAVLLSAAGSDVHRGLISLMALCAGQAAMVLVRARFKPGSVSPRALRFVGAGAVHLASVASILLLSAAGAVLAIAAAPGFVIAYRIMRLAR